MHKEIFTEKAPKPGCYSQGVVIDRGFYRIIHTSGMAADFPEDSKEQGLDGEGDIKQQTRRCLNNIKAVVEEAGGDISDIVLVDATIVDMKNNFAGFDEAYREFFPPEMKNKPVRMPFPAESLPWGGDYLVMMRATAYVLKNLGPRTR